MRTWSLRKGDPISLTLAADARLCKPDYVDDHIWEIHLGSSNPPALTAETTFGLRANSMRLFPRFVTSDGDYTDPETFTQPPILTSFLPNYLSFSLAPCEEMRVTTEYWVAEPKVIAGRLCITNESSITRTLHIALAALLQPMSEGEPMSPAVMANQQILLGKAGNLAPVLYLSGNPSAEQSPYPALAHTIELLPGNRRQFIWALAALKQPELSFDLAKQTIARSWDGEITRLELFNTSQMLEIYTGNPDWDATLALSQKVANHLLMQTDLDSTFPPFVISRQPDHGYSLRGDGSDYPSQWSNPTTLDLYYLTSLLLPGNASAAQNLLRNMPAKFAALNETTHTRSGKKASPKLNPLPLCASIACQIDRHLSDSNWLTEIYPQVLKGLKVWFTAAQDKDGDLFPEWSHVQQTGAPDCPVYNQWHPEGQGVDIKTLEAPALAGFLYKECQSLMQIAQKIHREDDIPWLLDTANAIRQELNSSWDASRGIFHYRDYQSHLSLAGEKLLDFQGCGKFPCNYQSDYPQRLLIRLFHSDPPPSTITITIQGQNKQDTVHEKLTTRVAVWSNQRACLTSQNLYTRVNLIKVETEKENITGNLQTVDYLSEDISLLIPLWSGACSPEQANIMIANFSQHLKPFGIPLSTMQQLSADDPNAVRMLWNHLVGEGLLSFGARAQAAELVTRLLNAASQALKYQSAFAEYYDAEKGTWFGERNSLHGLAPVGLFLQTLGVDKITKDCVLLSGSNPFPLPITIKFRGVTITRHPKDSVITFPTGQTISLRDPGPHYITI
ncbi:MAG: hypothetical protein HPY45_01650 [Anaerolineae bacterium]|nr:hypothetical protein [Anaerolineae bacterium]